jgi:zinc protease
MKSAIGQSDARRYETGAQKAAFIRDILNYNLAPNFVEQQAKLLQGMTKEEINKITRKYVQPDKMNVLLVGDKAKILEGVKKLGYEIVELDADGKPVSDKKVM